MYCNETSVLFPRLIKPADCAHACSKLPKCMSWTTNGPTSCLLKDKMPLHAWATGIVSGLKTEWTLKSSMLTSSRPGFFPQSGSTTLHVVDEDGKSGSFAVADDFNDIWQNFSKHGKCFMIALDIYFQPKCFNLMLGRKSQQASSC